MAANTINQIRTIVTCLLHDEGGWWSAGCVTIHIARRWPDSLPPSPFAEVLIAMSLVELVRDGHAEAQLSNRGTLFSYIR